MMDVSLVLARLTDRQRRVVLLLLVGATQDEAAKRLGMRKEAVAELLAAAARKLGQPVQLPPARPKGEPLPAYATEAEMLDHLRCRCGLLGCTPTTCDFKGSRFTRSGREIA